MHKIVVSIFLVLTFLCSPAIGEIITIKQTVKQTFGGAQSPDDARISGIAKAKREALEQAGTYIESLTVVQNSKVEKDEILALTAGVLKAEVISQKNYASDDAFGIEIVVNVIVDTSVLEERVKKQLQDRTHLAQLKDTQKREKELLQKVAQLEEENRKLTAEKQNTQQLKEQFQQASQGLTAVDWFYKAGALWAEGKYTDPKKVLEYLNNAIKLQPDLAEAYNNRGNAYSDLGQYQNAIEDYNKAIRLQPDYAKAYSNRGLAYADLGQYQSAIKDYDEAIRLQPDLAEAYNNRGIVYYDLGQYKRAIEDYSKAIRLQPDYAKAYYNRGLAYSKHLDEYQLAIEDYNKAIRLDPNYAQAYNDRGAAYILQGNNKRGCRDAQKACELGNCKALEVAKSEGYCR
jgi:tetratricopeptide (TPR) repeat protein